MFGRHRSETAFNCPHCRALAKQTWFSTHVDPLKSDEIPLVLEAESAKAPWIDKIPDHALRAAPRRFDVAGVRPNPVDYSLHNVSVSRCFNCHQLAIWIHDRLVWPSRGEAAAPPNPDLPQDVRADYDEAGTILDLSPRGAAALLRLAIQKLCLHLGGTGKNLNDDIAALVRKGLDPQIQQAFGRGAGDREQGRPSRPDRSPR
jgi:hypothetical protein